ncbi:MAG: 16S rRNA (guanine(527)-N(7))-methyltransferase RsmG [Coriobacteriia bacterium]|nr:16S rRNA (guanine(527)-N(7))-methyltransferase RsmG [Coriobacteriia bacterium]
MFHVKPESDIISPMAIREALMAAGVPTTEEQSILLGRHAERVIRSNAVMNLTRIVEPDDVIRLHIVDSLAFLPHVGPDEGKIVDLGSGAGFPGIPLAILGRDVTLCESSLKKAKFLQECVEDLGLSCAVAGMRAEELALSNPRAADWVIARAVTSLASLVELASPLLRKGGRLLALKGREDSEEEFQADRACALCGMRLLERRAYGLSGGEVRTCYVYEWVAEPSKKLPRRVGLAQKRPLG